MEIPDTVHSAPGWRVLGDRPHFTCVYPPGCQPAPDVVAAIKEICPDLIPVWMSERYLPPESMTPITLGWHVFARHVWNPRGLHAQFGILMPADWQGPAPNMFEIPLQGEPGPDGQPPAYEPLDWRTVSMLRKRYQPRGSTDLILKAQAANRERRAREKRRLLQEAAYQRKDVMGWIQRRIDTWDADDWRELYARNSEMEARRKHGDH